ncbi:MAG: hypothetical protein M1820_007134 [Bogoriella megaspora]|nr:MAG: hypothetical protein M1820_007134 [Bogoriella megaspora]
MQYVRSLSGSVSKTWNSINPSTLSGAIDVIVVEQEDGTLACSPFHVRFGKLSLLRPSEKKVEFKVNDVKQEYAMKLGDGGEAFFVFGTSQPVAEEWQTSPVVSPASSPQTQPIMEETPIPESGLPEPEFLDLASGNGSPSKPSKGLSIEPVPTLSRQSRSDIGVLSSSVPLSSTEPQPDWSNRLRRSSKLERAASETLVGIAKEGLNIVLSGSEEDSAQSRQRPDTRAPVNRERSTSPPVLPPKEALARAKTLSKKLMDSKIPSQVTDEGDLMLDMTGYKSSEDEASRAEVIARKIISEEIEGDYDIGALIGIDEKGNMWMYSSEESKEAAARKVAQEIHGLQPTSMVPSDAISDPGYHSDDNRSVESSGTMHPHYRRDSDSAVSMTTPPGTSSNSNAGDATKSYAKTLRLTSDQLKAMNLKPGINPMSFSVNKAVCQANMYYWRYDVPIVISDIDGTITKSDALGHLLNMIGRDWTHLGVAKLFTDIVANGYNIFYLTSRSVGQADTTRTYLNGIVQDGYRLPKGPVILSPDRTYAALRREIYLRKPEVFKMSCLRDIASLFSKERTPFYAGFGNRFTDALSYRSVNIPSTRIFTINSNAEVSLDMLTLNTYKTGYVSMRETVDHFFPPVGLLVKGGGEQYTDFNYWRDQPLAVDDFSASESEDESDDETPTSTKRQAQSEDEGSELGESMRDSYFSRESIDETGELGDSIIESVGGENMTNSMLREETDAALEAEDEDSEDDEGDDEDEDEEVEATEEMEALDLAGQTPKKLSVDDMRENLRDLATSTNSPQRMSGTSVRPGHASEGRDWKNMKERR